MPLHPLTNFEIHKCYQREPKFNGVSSKNNSSEIKGGKYITNLDEYESIWTHSIPLYVNAKNATYFVIFEVEHILKQVLKSIGNKNINRINIYRIHIYRNI